MRTQSGRTLWKNSREAERTLWRYIHLRQLKEYKLRGQFPLGRYILDSVCLEKKVIIEIDGGTAPNGLRRN